MKPITKIGVVVGGYIVALLLAVIAVWISTAFTNGPDPQAASGMYAFGDMLLFIAVFGVAAIVPTGVGLFFLRPYRAFWQVISLLGIAIAFTGISAVVLYELGRHATAPSPLASWAAFSVLRILVTPILALVFLACAALSTYRVPRMTFLAATLMEGAAAGYMALVWFVPLFFARH